jgi:hypothetical protein
MFHFCSLNKFCSLFNCTSPCKVKTIYSAVFMHLLSCKHHTRPPCCYGRRKLNTKMVGQSRMESHSYQNEKPIKDSTCRPYHICTTTVGSASYYHPTAPSEHKILPIFLHLSEETSNITPSNMTSHPSKVTFSTLRTNEKDTCK